jgi:hypothetical protein
MATQPLKARKYQNMTEKSVMPVKTCGEVWALNPDSIQENHTLDEESLKCKYLPLDKRCLVTRVLKIEEEKLFCKSELEEFKDMAEISESPPKEFLKAVYGSKKYQEKFGKKKRGSKAINWRKAECGEFICPSLHDANNIYEALGKKIWNRNQNKKKYSVAPEEDRCSFTMNNGHICSKRKCKNSQYCTLHHRKLTMDRIA